MDGNLRKARERTAGDFPLVSAAFGARLTEGRLSHVRLVLGGVAPTPRACPEAEALLEGQAPSRELIQRAAQAAFAAARPLAHNGYKLDLGRALVARAIGQIARGV
jgi:xanthine dehydrogenase YagS FAD-binding subunit